MTFRDYCSLMAKSVAETGYNLFHPSAYVPGLAKDELHVLDGELSDEGEELIALSWAESLATGSEAVFLAFRVGERRVKVIEFRDRSVIDSLVIRVSPCSDSSI